MIIAALALFQAAAAPAFQQLRLLGMTDAGVAVLQRMAPASPDDQAFAARRAALRERLRVIANSQPLDVEGFAGLLKAEAQARGEAQVRIAEKTSATLRALPAEDRAIFARVIAQQTLRAQAPAKPTAPKPATP